MDHVYKVIEVVGTSEASTDEAVRAAVAKASETIRDIGYRFEGQSDPADNAIMYVVETGDGVKGTLIDAYGAYADENVNKFMSEVEEISKKEIKS